MLAMNFVGKPCAGKPHARFDEGGRIRTPASTLLDKSPANPVIFGFPPKAPTSIYPGNPADPVIRIPFFTSFIDSIPVKPVGRQTDSEGA